MASRTSRRLIGAAVAFGVLGAACAGNDPSTQPAAESTPMATMDHGDMSPAAANAVGGIDTPAAKLVQGLTDLLDSHVFLAGIAVEQAVITKDPESPQFVAAAETLDRNSQDLAAAIESVYGPEAGDQFLDLWRQHIDFFVQYTVGGITGDKKSQADAKAKLDQYRQDFGAFIDSATKGELPSADVAAALQEHVDSLITTIDLAIAGDTEVFSSLYDSASLHMPSTASALAGGIVAGESLEGSVDSPAAKLQQDLTNLLDSHVFLAGIAVEQAVITKDPESPQFVAAAETLDRNSQDLAAAIESVYGPEAGDQFLDLWRQHIDFFVQYTVGGITGDKKSQADAKAKLDQYRQDFGAFIDSATKGELPSADVAAALQEHVDSLITTIDLAIAGDTEVFSSLYDSASLHMPGTASALAGGIVASNPEVFAGS